MTDFSAVVRSTSYIERRMGTKPTGRPGFYSPAIEAGSRVFNVIID